MSILDDYALNSKAYQCRGRLNTSTVLKSHDNSSHTLVLSNMEDISYAPQGRNGPADGNLALGSVIVHQPDKIEFEVWPP
jgi:hypothetical protein